MARRRKKGEWYGSNFTVSASGDTAGDSVLVGEAAFDKYTHPRIGRVVGGISLRPGVDPGAAPAQLTLVKFGIILRAVGASEDPGNDDDLGNSWLHVAQLHIGVGGYRARGWDSDSNAWQTDTTGEQALPGPGSIIPWFPIDCRTQRRVRPQEELVFAYNNDEVAGTAQNTIIYGIFRILIFED